MQRDTVDAGKYGRRGSPWEFNLRDVFRWCELMINEQSFSDDGGIDVNRDGCEPQWEPWLLVDTLYIQRMRTRGDREALLSCFEEAFPEAFSQERSAQETSSELFSERSSKYAGGGIGTHPVLRVTPDWVEVGHTVLPRGCWTEAAVGIRGGEDGLKTGMPMAFAFRRPLHALARSVVGLLISYALFVRISII